jgi:hypothetical protein
MVALIVTSYRCHLAVIHPHVTCCSFSLFGMVVSESKLSSICLTFTRTLNQLHFTLLFMLTSFCTISYSILHVNVFTNDEWHTMAYALLEYIMNNDYDYIGTRFQSL